MLLDCGISVSLLLIYFHVMSQYHDNCLTSSIWIKCIGNTVVCLWAFW